ncbi:MAG TPA: bifunctional UDP-N-acetylmuramoyl-tripeptide:D-alanyl-D-alanine ligase/alanine racemase, partial [Chitinophagaceae bacterium]|nr:bifunctional UDP-N-acetylmuramoyl-tripeptide:D-alanyl-D-alanine ligase/alanine racemase [Chitinophagaceae bacterium]
MIDASSLSVVLKGKCMASGSDLLIDHILTDSRKISHPASSLFIPLISSRRNAHQFITEVYQAGVRCFLVSEEIDIKSFPKAWFIKVENTLQALQTLAAWHRQHFQLPVIGITGSNGKTIVKEWLYQLLEPDYNIVRSPKSFNSQIGVPISVWGIRKEHTLALFEAGISQSGEMDHLEKMIRPDIGIFTNIGETHNEGFLNMRHKINEKLILFRNAHTLIYSKDYHELHECILQFAAQLKANAGREIRLLNWSRKTEAVLQVKAIIKAQHESVLEMEYQQQSFHITIPFTDDAYIEDSIHCCLVMLELGCTQEQIASRMQKLVHVAMRLELKNAINNCTLINDSYNSDVNSFSIAIDFLLQQNQHEQKTVILSDILQSGRDNELYDEVAALLKQKGIKRLIGIGESIYRNKSVFRQNRKLHSTFYKNTEDFLEALDTTSFENESILLKGARKYRFEKIAKRLEERIHQTVLEIQLDALSHNLNTYKSLLKKPVGIMAMVKAFSYGSGSFEVANKLAFEGIDYLAVAYTDEGISLRKNGIKLPMMVMNADESSFDLCIEWKLEPEIYNRRTFQLFCKAAQEADKMQYPVHIKLDTGMHRLGFGEDDMDWLIRELQWHPELKVASVFSHLSGSEEPELDAFTKRQADAYRSMCARLEAECQISFIKHLCNSSAIVRHQDLHFDMVRLGLGLYGIDSSDTLSQKLRNVSRMRSTIAQIKRVSPEETIGYNRKGILHRETLIGTVCVGYADGIPRNIGNGKGYMLVKGKPAPIVGNVCMDMCMLDLTDIEDVEEGDSVLIFGTELSVKKLAEWAGTIPYEILT